MTNEIIRKLSPEEEELEIKKKKLAELSVEISTIQLEISTINSAIYTFKGLYLSRLGQKFLKLDKLLAILAEKDVKNNPDDEAFADKAKEATERMNTTAEEVGEYANSNNDFTAFKPSQNLKSLFRKVSKLIHPDLATDEEDRKRRERLMQQANEAYRNHDELRLQEILDNQSLLSDKVYRDIGEELVVTIRLISNAKIQIEKMKREVEQLLESEEWKLKTQYEENIAEGIDIFDQMEKEIDQKIKQLEMSI